MDDHDYIMSFDAVADHQIEYRPSEDTLADAARSSKEYNVYTERRAEINPD